MFNNIDKEQKKTRKRLLAEIAGESPPTLDELKAGAEPTDENFDPFAESDQIADLEVEPAKKKLIIKRSV